MSNPKTPPTAEKQPENSATVSAPANNTPAQEQESRPQAAQAAQAGPLDGKSVELVVLKPFFCGQWREGEERHIAISGEPAESPGREVQPVQLLPRSPKEKPGAPARFKPADRVRLSLPLCKTNAQKWLTAGLVALASEYQAEAEEEKLLPSRKAAQALIAQRAKD